MILGDGEILGDGDVLGETTSVIVVDGAPGAAGVVRLTTSSKQDNPW